MESLKNNYYITTEVNNDIEILEEIPDNVIGTILDYNKSIIDFIYYVRKLEEINLNHKDFTEHFENYKLRQSKRKQDVTELNLIYVDINRLFVNFITSIRVFIEHLENRLVNKYSKDSDAFRLFKQTTGNWYNKYFSYRLFYHLRNFSIHIDYPINSFFSEYEYDNDHNIKQYKFKVEFQKSHLLKDKKIKSKLSNDLRSYSEKFPVAPLIQEILLPVSEFLPFVVNLDSNDYIKSANELNKILVKYKEHSEISISKWTQVNNNIGKWSSKIIPSDLIRRIIENKKTLPKK